MFRPAALEPERLQLAPPQSAPLASVPVLVQRLLPIRLGELRPRLPRLVRRQLQLALVAPQRSRARSVACRFLRPALPPPSHWKMRIRLRVMVWVPRQLAIADALRAHWIRGLRRWLLLASAPPERPTELHRDEATLSQHRAPQQLCGVRRAVRQRVVALHRQAARSTNRLPRACRTRSQPKSCALPDSLPCFRSVAMLLRKQFARYCGSLLPISAKRWPDCL